MIKFENINKSFGKLHVLKNINLFFEPATTIALIGPNGSGKTTLLKSLLGLVIPDKGEIIFQGEKIIGTSEYRHHIGYMPQIGRYPEHLRIRQLFSMMRDVRSNHVITDEELLEEFHLIKIFDKRMGTLSGGTRQKVSAVLAYLFNPDVMVLDEPTAGLDPEAAEILKQKVIQSKKKNKLTIITSHNMNDVEELADRIVFMVDGDVKFFKTIEEIKFETGEPKLGRALTALNRELKFNLN